MSEVYRELRVTFPSEFIARDDPENVTYQEYLISRGLPAETYPYTMMKTTSITVRLDEPLSSHVEEYLKYLQSQHVIEDWLVTEEQTEEED